MDKKWGRPSFLVQNDRSDIWRSWDYTNSVVYLFIYGFVLFTFSISTEIASYLVINICFESGV